MNRIFKLLIAIVLCTTTYYAKAQTDSVQTKESYFKAGISFLNNNVFVGRTDTVVSPSLSSKISYTLKSGIYFSGGIDYFTTRKTNALDGGNIEAGYDYSINDDLNGGVSFTKLFYNANSTRVSASISSELNAYLDYDIADIITPAINIGYSIAKSGFKNDILLNPKLSRDFAFENIMGKKRDLLLISPEVAMNAGTQNFYDGYLTKLTTKNRRSSGLTAAELVIYNQNLKNYKTYLGKFSVLDYELSVPVVYKSGHVIFSFTPTFVFPQNGLLAPENAYQKAIQKGIPSLQSSEFYFETGVTIKF
jgi:hypothetical protein